MIVKLEDHPWLRDEMLEKASKVAGKVVGSFFLTKIGMEAGVIKAVRKGAEEALRPYNVRVSWGEENLAEYLSTHMDVTFDFSPESETDLDHPWSRRIFIHTDRMKKLLQKNGLLANADDARAVAESLLK